MNQVTITPEILAVIQSANDDPAAVREACHLLKLQPEELVQYQFAVGLAFLDNHLALPEADKLALQKSPMYWRWFVIYWNRADDYLRKDRESWLAVDMQRAPEKRQEIHKMGVFYYLRDRKISVWSHAHLITDARKEALKAA